MSGVARDWPRVGLGCASLGAPSLSDRDAQAVIEAAVEHGVRLFDVAPLYGGGLAEERLGRVLRRLPRDAYVLCTKTGVTRPYGQTPRPAGSTRRRQFDVWDYGAAATIASIERSCDRLGVDRLDVVHLHDVEHRVDASMEAYHALERLREQGVVGGIGVGSNLLAPVEALMARARLDAILVAGCYTLLVHAAAPLFDRAARDGVKVIAGGVFNSGVLAAWPQASPTFDYEPAPQDVVARTGRIASICARHDVPIGAAALQFVRANPAVTTLLLGAASVAELEAGLAALRHPIPDKLWRDLADAGLIPRGAPVSSPTESVS
jgi:D-threo-aldose 1-dehydrogenase